MATTMNKVALVTGAAQGLGRTIASRLAQDGFSLVLNDISSKTSALELFCAELEEKYPGRRYAVVTADVSQEHEVAEMIKKAVDELGGLDVMVANAGRGGVMVPFLEEPIKQLDDLWATNVRGTMLCFQYAAKQMIAQGRGGRIIGAGSLASKKGWILKLLLFFESVQGKCRSMLTIPTGYRLLGAYAATKFAIRGLTQSAADDLGKYDITVNSYAPGLINTELGAGLFENTGISVEDFFKKAHEENPLKRGPDVEDVAAVVSFLASEGARNITGQTINVNAGRYFD